MYLCECVMRILKGIVKNLARPEVSIIQQFVCEEVVTWCIKYIGNTKEIRVPKSQHHDWLQDKGTFDGKDKTMDNLVLMHMEKLYLLKNLSEVHPYLTLQIII